MCPYGRQGSCEVTVYGVWLHMLVSTMGIHVRDLVPFGTTCAPRVETHSLTSHSVLPLTENQFQHCGGI